MYNIVYIVYCIRNTVLYFVSVQMRNCVYVCYVQCAVDITLYIEWITGICVQGVLYRGFYARGSVECTLYNVYGVLYRGSVQGVLCREQ